MHTSVAMLQALKLDLAEIAGADTIVPVSIYVQYTSGLSPQPNVKIFDGDVVSVEWDFDQDSVVIHARDHAGVFVDQRRILTRDAKTATQALAPLSPGQVLNPQGISTVNRLVSQVVTDIAENFGYTPVLNMTSGSDVPAGASYGGNDHTYMTIPQNLWSVLNELARDTGNEVYTTPDRRLVFGQPGAGLQTIPLSWNVPVLSPVQNWLPVADLRVVHNPRRNGTFRVLVTSYDPARAQPTIGRATFIGSNLATPSLKEGVYSGPQALTADSALLQMAQTRGYGTVRDLSHVQLYTFHWDGYSTSDANAKAASIASDISKRLMVMSGRIDGYPTMAPTQPLTMHAGPSVPGSFAGNTWYVSGYRHKFTMPGKGHSRGRRWDGFTTEFSALDLPATALGGSAI